jgi:hypothetical protein
MHQLTPGFQPIPPLAQSAFGPQSKSVRHGEHPVGLSTWHAPASGRHAVRPAPTSTHAAPRTHESAPSTHDDEQNPSPFTSGTQTAFV